MNAANMSEDARSVVVVGASAAGLRCACRLSRLRPDWKIRVVESRRVFSYAACGLPYALSGDVGDPEALRRTDYGVTRDAAYFDRYKAVEVLAGHRAVSVDVGRRTLGVEGPEGARELAWDDLVLAVGAEPRRLEGQPDHPRVASFHVWEDVEPFRRALAKGEIDRVALVGAGLVGCELAEAFRCLWGAEVTLLEATGAPLPGMLDPELGACVARRLEANGVRVQLGSPVERIDADAARVHVVAGGETFEASVAVVAVGVRPVVDLARRAGVELGSTGAIAVDDRFATSVPHVWAVGDCTEVRHAVTGRPVHAPLGSLANRQGRTLGNVLAGRPDVFPAVVGAVAVKVFDWSVAATGCTETRARDCGLPARSVWLAAPDRAHYWPEAREIYLKLVYDGSSRRVLGVQAAGEGEVVKRVDVATQLIARGATLEEFAHLEHAYAPPYAPAMEPLAVVALTAQNQEDGIEAVSPCATYESAGVLDVRLREEAERQPASAGHCSRIELGELTGRLGEVDESTELVVCERGTRAAEAVRFLRGHAIRTRYLGGGLHWRAATGGDARVERPEKP